jgi:hypothetical protein
MRTQTQMDLQKAYNTIAEATGIEKETLEHMGWSNLEIVNFAEDAKKSVKAADRYGRLKVAFKSTSWIIGLGVFFDAVTELKALSPKLQILFFLGGAVAYFIGKDAGKQQKSFQKQLDNRAAEIRTQAIINATNGTAPPAVG